MFKKIKKALFLIFKYLGFYPEQLVQNFKGYFWYRSDLKAFKRKQASAHTNMKFGVMMPILRDKAVGSGNLSGHYFHQDLLVAQRIFKNNPIKHVDIGSRTDGFVTHVASYREIEVFDIRPSDVQIENIKFVQADFMDTDPALYDYADSVSCLHVIEHFGLGRYGDPIDPDGHLKGLDNIYKVLKKGGKFYFSTPIGSERINFNAHRVFAISTLLSLFEGKYLIDHFHFVDDRGDLHKNADVLAGKGNSFGLIWGCGIFEMTKI